MEPTIFDFQEHLFDQGIPTHSLLPTRSYLNDTSDGTYGAMGGYGSLGGSLSLGIRKQTPNTSIGLENSMYSTKPQPTKPTNNRVSTGRGETVPILKEVNNNEPSTLSSSATSNSSSSSWKRYQ